MFLLFPAPALDRACVCVSVSQSGSQTSANFYMNAKLFSDYVFQDVFCFHSFFISSTVMHKLTTTCFFHSTCDTIETIHYCTDEICEVFFNILVFLGLCLSPTIMRVVLWKYNDIFVLFFSTCPSAQHLHTSRWGLGVTFVTDTNLELKSRSVATNRVFLYVVFFLLIKDH